MKFCRIVGVIGIWIFFLAACRQPTDEELYYKVQKKLGELESYRCTAKIVSVREDEEREYIFKQTFKYPNYYRLEILKPDHLQGNLTLSNGKTSWFVNPSINQISKFEHFHQSQEKMMFIGYFLENLMKGKESEITTEQDDHILFIVITTPIPGGNYYFDRQKLWVDTEKLVPVRMNVLDQNGNVRFRVFYEDFEYNPVLENSLFYIHIKK